MSRRAEVERAQRELEDVLARLVDPHGRHHLSYAELWFIMSMVSATWASGAVKDERKGAAEEVVIDG